VGAGRISTHRGVWSPLRSMRTAAQQSSGLLNLLHKMLRRWAPLRGWNAGMPFIETTTRWSKPIALRAKLQSSLQ